MMHGGLSLEPGPNANTLRGGDLDTFMIFWCHILERYSLVASCKLSARCTYFRFLCALVCQSCYHDVLKPNSIRPKDVDVE